MPLVLIEQSKSLLELGAVILTEIPAGKRLEEDLRKINRLVSVLSQLTG
jgi:hypothetical protein